MLGLDALLQVDATVIAGILILLTLTSYKVSESDSKKFFRGFTKEGMTALVVIPFAISAIQILLKYVQYSPTDSLTGFDVVFPIGGFGYLILVVCLIARSAKVKAMT